MAKARQCDTRSRIYELCFRRIELYQGYEYIKDWRELRDV